MIISKSRPRTDDGFWRAWDRHEWLLYTVVALLMLVPTVGQCANFVVTQPPAPAVTLPVSTTSSNGYMTLERNSLKRLVVRGRSFYGLTLSMTVPAKAGNDIPFNVATDTTGTVHRDSFE